MKTGRFVSGLAVVLAIAACSRKPAARAAASAPPPPKPMSYELRLGRATFQHYCQNCHGETGAGDGFNAFNLDPHPRDLSDPAFQKKKTDADLTDAIQRGGAGVGLSAMMPPWGRTLSKEQVEQVVLYLRSLSKH
jgi:mono/diheme cytochrome c family protein